MNYIIGIDEVGRGPIAGPVAVCAFLCQPEFFSKMNNDRKDKDLPLLRDSKKLSKSQRHKWFVYLNVAKTCGFCDYAISYVSSENIDKFGIKKCIQKALDNSLEKLILRSQDLINIKDIYVYLDGGLKAKAEFVNQKTIIKGDESEPVISCASIVAKVSRDRVMENLSKDYPSYGFDKHAGYGTRAHYEAIKKYGQTPIHRKSFIH